MSDAIRNIPNSEISTLYIQKRDKKGSLIGDPVYFLGSPDAAGPNGNEEAQSRYPVFSYLYVKEDIFSPALNGTLGIIDRNRLIERMELSPLDLLVMDINQDGIDKPKRVYCSITSYFQKDNESDIIELGSQDPPRKAEIHFSSIELSVLNYTQYGFLDQDFIGPISGQNGLVQYLSKTIVEKNATQFSTAKPIKTDETYNWVYIRKNHDYYPWGKPSSSIRFFQLMNFLSENAVDKKNPNAANFLFWQDIDGWNFRSIESIISEYENQDILSFKFTVNDLDARKIIKVDMNPDGDPETDFLRLINASAFGSYYIFVEPKYSQDPYARYLDTQGSHEFKNIKYSYLKDREKWKSIEQYPIITENDYLEKWEENRKTDERYGYFEPAFFNRKKKVNWEYYGYTLSSRNEDTTWQTMFDITDMDGETLKKIQTQIKEPLAKKKHEYAKKMNLKEKWNVYRCSVCCAGLMEDGSVGNTLTNELSSYEIVAAGSFTDVLNFDKSKITQNSENPFQRSGLTLSYDLTEYPYSLSLGEFFNLERNPDVFTKYRFDLEIKRCEKLLDILQKNIQARTNRISQYETAKEVYKAAWNEKEEICLQSSCAETQCVCPSEHYAITENKVDSIIKDHESLISHEENILNLQDPVSIQAAIQRLQDLKQEFQSLYESYWNRRAFFFSKDIDYSFLKSGNNLFNVKSIKRIPIRGTKYEKFATRKAFAGYTLENGLTLSYDYSVSKELCGATSNANPYYDRKYSDNVKSDFWESFENPLSKFPYTENDIAKGPIWYRNWKVKYRYIKTSDYCINNPESDCCNGLVDICHCSCGVARDARCNPEPGAFSGLPLCSDYGEEGVDYAFGACENNPFLEQCNSQPTVSCIFSVNTSPPDFICDWYYAGTITQSCCDDFDASQSFPDDISLCQYLQGLFPSCSQVGTLWTRANCSEVLGQGSSGSTGSTDIPTAGALASTSSSCDFNRNDLSVYEAEQEMYFESFSNNKNANTLINSTEIYGYAIAKLDKACSEERLCDRIEIISITPANEEPQLLHPWAADEITPGFDGDDYIDYKKSASLFNDDLSESVPPALSLEGMESFVRVEFSSPIGLESLKDFPEGFVNKPGSEYFLPYIVLLTAGPFGAEAAKANVSVIGQDPYGFDIAVKKTKNKDDFAKMNLHDTGADPAFTDSCNVFSTASSWLRHAQNVMFYKPNSNHGEIFTPVGLQDIFTASSLQRSVPVKSWWDLWVSLPPTAMVAYYNRTNVDESTRGTVPFYEEGAIAGQPKTVWPSSDIGNYEGWPIFITPSSENIVSGAYPGNAAIVPNQAGSDEQLVTGQFEVKLSPNEQVTTADGEPERYLSNDPSNVNYYFADFPNVRNIDNNKQYPVISYPIGTMIYGGAGFTAGQVWKYDSSRMTEYGIVQLNSDSMPSIISLMGTLGANIQDIQKYYNWVSDKLIDWYQNTIFDNNFAAQFVVFSKQTTSSCKDYPCANPSGFADNSNCPADDPLCNCPCQELRPDKIKFVKDRFTGIMTPAATADFGPEPSSIELRKLKEETNECSLIKSVLGEEWLGCVWDDPESPYNCNCPCIGEKFYDYMKYNQLYSTFWSTPLETPLYRNAQMNLLLANKMSIIVTGDLNVKPGQLIFLDSMIKESSSDKQKRMYGKWLVYKIERTFLSKNHMMKLYLCRDSSSKESV